MLYTANRSADTIEANRQQGLADMMEALAKLVCRFNGEVVRCNTNFRGIAIEDRNYACDSMIIGTLVKSASICGLWSLPPAPYTGMSIKKTAEDIKSLKVMGFCDSFYTSYAAHITPRPAH
jgi:hypothetical protein